MDPRRRNFIWKLTHELGHALSFKEAFGYEIMNDVLKEEDQSEFYKEWIALQKEVIENAEELTYDSETGTWKQIRPEGYPTLYSYFATSGRSSGHEQFADTVAYILLGYTYGSKEIR